MGYTTRAGVELIALGASGISELSDAYAQSVRTADEWIARMRAGGLATMRGWRMSDDDMRRKWLIQRLMCQGEVSRSHYAAVFEETLTERIPDLEDRLSPFVTDGLLTPVDGSYQVSALGRLSGHRDEL
jgi:oxygen-independent coproporphyrinogen-3 oxidase